MDAVNQRLTHIASRSQRYVTLTWYIVRSPKTTGVLLVILVMVLLLGLLIPQQSETVFTAAPDPTTWITSLPFWLQPGGEVLFFLGFSKIFQTFWFWLPVALLLLNSLIALADYVPGSWRRLGKTTPPIEWQHPLARRVEHSVRLPSLPDDFLEALKGLLQETGFSLYAPVESEQRDTGAAQRRWVWLGVVVFYVGLIVLIGAFLMTYASVKTDRFTLSPFQPQSTYLFGGKFELTDVEATTSTSHVTYTSPGTEQSPRTLTWRRYWPSFLNNTLIFPVAMEPILTFEVRDASGALVELEPLQENLPSEKRLNLPLDEANTPLYFTIQTVDLAVQVSPDLADENVYNVQVLRDSGELLLEQRGIQSGQVFEVDQYAAVMFLNHKVTVLARRDPALPLYLLSLVLILIGLLLTFLWPPTLVWLIPEVKGIGGQLYGVMEKFGSERGMKQFLEKLLMIEASSEEQEGKSN
jgi:cytochrome c biogenesis protein ResB